MTLYSGNSLPNNVIKILKTMGDAEISKIDIARTPLSTGLKVVLNLISLGNFQKRLNQLPYDKLYHLALILTTSKGKFVLEKNELINMKKFTSNSKNTEIKTISSIPKGLTANIILAKTKQNMGGKFLSYSGYDNNCQTFAYSALISNGLGDSETKQFVLQDTQHLFKNDSRFRKILNTITDTAEVKTRIQQNPIVSRITHKFFPSIGGLFEPLVNIKL